MDSGTQPPIVRITPHLMFGLLMFLIGLALTLDNLDIYEAERFLAYWPVALIAIGVAKLWQVQGGHGRAVGGVLFVLLGSWLLLHTLDIVEGNPFAFWPVLLLVAGGVIIMQSVRRPRLQAGVARSDQTVNAVAILSGVTRGSNSSSFRGGELAAFMGGCEIDLREAAIHGEAVIDVVAMWGGIEIRVPESWSVIGNVTPLMGGFDDTTRPPREATAHTLVVRGFVLMGGIVVKN